MYIYFAHFEFVSNLVVRGMVPKFNLDVAFERKDEIAKAVEDELAQVIIWLEVIMC